MQAADRITVFNGAQKSEIPLKIIEASPFFRLADLQPIFGFQMQPVVSNQNLSLSIESHTVILSANRSLVSVDNKLVSLSRPAYLTEGEWYVPLDFIPKVLKITSTKRFMWLENNRSLMLGDIQPNQIQVRYLKEAMASRLVFQSVRPVSYSVRSEGSTILVSPETEEVVVAFQDTNIEDGIIRTITLQTLGSRKIFRIEAGEAYASYKSSVLNDPPRLVLDLLRKEQPSPEPAVPQTQPDKPAQPLPPTLLPSTQPQRPVIVIDPGHGGTETGAKGPNGTFEKEIVLGIARKLKTLIESNTSFRVILTRDTDRIVTLDERTALANNNKAELFVSIHANATLRGYGKGAETYFLSVQGTDDEARNVAAVENNAVGIDQQAPPVDGDLKLILWDMAQTEYLTESSQLAETIQQQLNATLGISNRGIKQAPFRVLMGAMMPAVLIEVGFINNPSEEKLLKDNDYQMKIAAAIFQSVENFRNARSQQASRLTP